MTKPRLIDTVFSVFALFVMATAPLCVAHAADLALDDDTIVMAEATLPDDVLDESRAGFIDSSGMIYRFAVDVRTQVDGAVTFTHQLTLDSNGAGVLNASSNTQLATNLPTGMSAAIINHGQGIVVTSADGTTTALSQTKDGGLANIIMNTANNRQITQTMNVNLILKSNPTTSLLNTVNALALTAHALSVGLGP